MEKSYVGCWVPHISILRCGSEAPNESGAHLSMGALIVRQSANYTFTAGIVA